MAADVNDLEDFLFVLSNDQFYHSCECLALESHGIPAAVKDEIENETYL